MVSLGAPEPLHASARPRGGQRAVLLCPELSDDQRDVPWRSFPSTQLGGEALGPNWLLFLTARDLGQVAESPLSPGKWGYLVEKEMK